MENILHIINKFCFTILKQKILNSENVHNRKKRGYPKNFLVFNVTKFFSHDNSKNKNRKIDFSFDSAHCASFIKTEAKLRGESVYHQLGNTLMLIWTWNFDTIIFKLSKLCKDKIWKHYFR